MVAFRELRVELDRAHGEGQRCIEVARIRERGALDEEAEEVERIETAAEPCRLQGTFEVP